MRKVWLLSGFLALALSLIHASGYAASFSAGNLNILQTGTPFPTETFTPIPPTAVPIPTSTPNDTPIPAATQADTPIIPTNTPGPSELSISSAEPFRITQLFGGSLSIYGSGFTPGTVVRLVGYGLLESAYVNATALRAIVPPNLPTRKYDIQVIRETGGMATLPNGVKVVGPEEPTATATISVAANRGFGGPQLIIETITTDPASIRPGDTFTLTLQIANRGDYTASGLVVTLNSLNLIAPATGSNVMIVGAVGIDQTITVEAGLILNQAAESGLNNLEISLNYSDYLGRTYNSPQTVGLNINTGLAESPLVILTTYSTDPATLTPGDSFDLTLSLTNVGGGSANQMTVTLGGEGGIGLKPFAMLGSGNVQFVPGIPGGQTVELVLALVVDGSATSGLYDIPIQLAYDDDRDNRLTQQQGVTLMVRRQPTLQIDYYQPVGTGLVGEELELPIEIINIGRDLVNISTLAVSSPDLEIVEGSIYLGALDGGTSASFDPRVIPLDSGTLEVLVTANYLDDFNQPQQFTQILSLQVDEPAAPEAQGIGPDETGSGLETFWQRIGRFFRGLFGLGS